MSRTQVHDLADYIIPGEPHTALVARVRAYTALALNNGPCAELLIECGVRADQRNAVNDIGLAMGREQARCPSCGLPVLAHAEAALADCGASQ